MFVPFDVFPSFWGSDGSELVLGCVPVVIDGLCVLADPSTDLLPTLSVDESVARFSATCYLPVVLPLCPGWLCVSRVA